MKLWSFVARRLVAGFCIAALLSLAIFPVGFGLPCAVPVPTVSLEDPGPASDPLRAAIVLPLAEVPSSATAARAPPPA